MKYLFTTDATMKEYNCNKYWIDPHIIGPITLIADNLADAIKKYQETVNDKYCEHISDHALKVKQPMYSDNSTNDNKQIGYVITAETHIVDQSAGIAWSRQYIDLWVSIQIVCNPIFPEV